MTALLLVARAAGPYLFVDEPARGPDGQGARLLVVEGWLDEDALDDAAAASRDGRYERVVTSGGPLEGWHEGQTATNFAERAAGYLRRHGLVAVPVVAVPAPASAQDRSFLSAVVVRDWIRREGLAPAAVDVYSAGVHARRSRMVYRLAFGPSVEIGVRAARPKNYDLDHWWRTSQGTKTVLDETLSLAWTSCCFWPPAAGSPEERSARPPDAALKKLSPRSGPRAVQEQVRHPCLEPAMSTRRLFLTVLAAAALTACASPPARAVGSLVDLQIVDRSRGETLPTWRHRGAAWVAGQPGRPLCGAPHQPLGGAGAGRPLGRRRQRRQRRHGGRRPDRLRPRALPVGRDHRLAQELHRSGSFLLHRAARFVRGAHRSSRQRRRDRRRGLPRAGGPAGAAPVGAAAAPGQPPVRRRRPARARAPRPGPGERQSSALPPTRRRASARMPPRPPRRHRCASATLAKAEKLGTGHGEREYSPTTQTAFERASTSRPSSSRCATTATPTSWRPA